MKFHIGQSDLVILGDADRRGVLAAIKDFGFTKVRFEVPFHAWSFPWQPYNWNPLSKTIAAVEAADLEALPVLGAHRPVFWKPSAKQYGEWCVQALNVLNTHQLIRQVEVWNEPNLINFWPKASPETFFPFADAAYDRIKAERPETEVVLAGMAAAATGIQWPFIGGPKDPVAFVTRLTELAKGRKFYDRLAYHPYNLTEGFTLAEPGPDVFGIKALPRVQALSPGVQVLVTEVGYVNTGSLDTYQDLAKHLSLLSGQDEIYLYCWRDTGGEKFGLVNTKGAPKNPYHDLVRDTVRASA